MINMTSFSAGFKSFISERHGDVSINDLPLLAIIFVLSTFGWYAMYCVSNAYMDKRLDNKEYHR